jgi:hypothetical protein
MHVIRTQSVAFPSTLYHKLMVVPQHVAICRMRLRAQCVSVAQFMIVGDAIELSLVLLHIVILCITVAADVLSYLFHVLPAFYSRASKGREFQLI